MYTVEEFDEIKTKAIKFIMYKKRTEQEVIKKLKEYDKNIVEDLIEYLKEAKYIDDLNYIERAIKDFIALNTLSIKEIKYKLMAKGLNKDKISNYIEENYEELLEYEQKNIEKIINKKNKNTEVNKLIAYLYNKGYNVSKIKKNNLYEEEDKNDATY